jgi:hypothetical protein
VKSGQREERSTEDVPAHGHVGSIQIEIFPPLADEENGAKLIIKFYKKIATAIPMITAPIVEVILSAAHPGKSG